MNLKKAEKFFAELGRQLSGVVSIYLTGGVAAWIYGGARVTEDIDFGVRAAGEFQPTEDAILSLAKKHRVKVEFSEDISRWGMVGYRDFARGAKLYRRYGRLRVYVLAPEVWSVGKINRYLESDIEDLRLVFKKTKISLKVVLNAWKQALRDSPRSVDHRLFVKKAENFLDCHGAEIWGADFSPESAKTRLALRD